MKNVILILIFLLISGSACANSVKAGNENTKIDRLIAKLKSGDWGEEMHVLQELANSKGEIYYYPSHLPTEARLNARDDLIKIGKPAVPRLLELFNEQLKETDSESMPYVCEALGGIGDESVVPTLAAALKHETKYVSIMCEAGRCKVFELLRKNHSELHGIH